MKSWFSENRIAWLVSLLAVALFAGFFAYVYSTVSSGQLPTSQNDQNEIRTLLNRKVRLQARIEVCRQAAAEPDNRVLSASCNAEDQARIDEFRAELDEIDARLRASGLQP